MSEKGQKMRKYSVEFIEIVVIERLEQGTIVRILSKKYEY